MNNLIKLRILVLFFLIPGEQFIYGQGVVQDSMIQDGQMRHYLLYVPESYTGNEAVPLILNFHGFTSTAKAQLAYGDFRKIAEREQVILVHPQGTLHPTQGYTYWNAHWEAEGVDDVGFASALIDSIAHAYNINLDRVYSTGMSNGGFMSYTLACALGDKIAAIASVAGSMTVKQLSTFCQPNHSIPIMQIHGTADNLVPYGGNQDWMAPIDEVIAYWVKYNNCVDSVQLTQIEDIDTNDGCKIEKYSYSNCENKTTIELLKVINGGHTWPGASKLIGVTNKDINASEEIWNFFSKYSRKNIAPETKEK